MLRTVKDFYQSYRGPMKYVAAVLAESFLHPLKTSIDDSTSEATALYDASGLLRYIKRTHVGRFVTKEYDSNGKLRRKPIDYPQIH